MRKIRIAIQVVFLALFVGLLYFINNQARGYALESEFLLRFNPFTALLTLLASHSILFSFAITAYPKGLTESLRLTDGRHTDRRPDWLGE